MARASLRSVILLIAIGFAVRCTNGDALHFAWTLPDHFPKGMVLRVTVEGGTLAQAGNALSWNSHGFYEIALDAGSLDWSP